MEDGNYYSCVKETSPVTIENDIRPISLTPIIAKVFESFLLKWINVYVKPQIDDKQYGGMAGTCTTNALVEMLHKWYESTDVTGNYVRVLFLDYSKAFDLINHDILLSKMIGMEVPAHLVRWMEPSCVLTRSRTESENRRRCVKTRVSQRARCSPRDFVRAKTLFSPYQ